MNRYKGVLQKKSLSANIGYCPFVFKHFSLSSQSYTVLCVEMLSLSRPKGTGNPQQFKSSSRCLKQWKAWREQSSRIEHIQGWSKWLEATLSHITSENDSVVFPCRSIHTYTFDCITNEVKPLFCNQWAMNSIATKKYRRFNKPITITRRIKGKRQSGSSYCSADQCSSLYNINCR